MPPVALAGAVGVAPEILMHAWTYLAALVGIGFAAWKAIHSDRAMRGVLDGYREIHRDDGVSVLVRLDRPSDGGAADD